MLIHFTVGPNVLQLTEYDDAQKADIIANLGRSWIRVGLLISHQTSTGTCAIADQASLLPQHMRKEWITLLSSAEKRSRLVTLNVCIAADDPSTVIAKISKHIELIYVRREDAARYGIPEGEASILDLSSGCEICRFDCNSSSFKIQKALEAYSGVIRKGTDTSFVWKTLVRPLALNNSKLIVVDRYAVTNINGLCRLFEELNSLEGDRYVTVFSSCCSSDLDDLKKSVRENLKRLQPGSLREVTLYLASDQAFKREAHYRYIHFVNDCCLQCDTGLEILQGQQVFRNSPYKFCPPENALVSCESKLRQDSSTKKDVFTRGEGLPRRAPLADRRYAAG